MADGMDGIGEGHNVSMKRNSGVLLNRSVKIVFGFIVLLVFGIVVLVDKRILYSKLCMVETALPNIALVAGVVGLLGAGLVVWRLLARRGGTIKAEGRVFVWGLVGLAFLLLGLQVMIAYHIYFFAGWDPSIVVGVADRIAQGQEGIGSYYYYSQYTNNIAITFILAVVQKFAFAVGLEVHRYFVCVVVGCVLVNLSAVFTALCVKELTGSGTAGLAGFILYGLLGAVSPWITVPYTDTYSVLFPVLTFYLYVRMLKCHRGRYWYLCGMGIAGGVGYFIKPSAGIVLIAILLFEICRLAVSGRFDWRKAACGAAGLGGAFLVLCGIRGVMLTYTGCELNKELKFSFTHYLMMGLNEETTGSYHSADYGFSSSFETTAERSQGNLEVVSKRLREYGPMGLAQFAVKKLLLNYNDGTFGWWLEGGFLLGESPNPPTLLQQRLRRVFYTESDWYLYYATTVQFIWLGVLGMQGGGLVVKSRNLKREEVVLMIGMIGIFLFVMLFEGRARYLYCMLPMYVVSAVWGGKALYLQLTKS